MLVLVAGLGWSAHPAEAKYAALVLDPATGRIFHEANADERNYPASLTKMMTLYLVFEALENKRITWNTTFKASRHASAQPPTHLALAPGETLTVRDAVHAMIILSANDAAVAAAEMLGGTEEKFALMMTDKARQLGMSRTTFRNASGLPNSGQMSTARDMATLAEALMKKFPQHYPLFSETSFSYKDRVYKTHNHVLVDYPGADGLKTGFTGASGFNLVTSAERDGKRLIGVVFGGNTARARDNHMEELLDEGFANFNRPTGRLMVKNEAPAEMPTAAAKKSGKKAAPAAAAVAKAKPAPAPTLPAAVVAAAEGEGDTDANDNTVWGIQVGAFNEKGPAHNAAEQVARKYSDVLSGGHITIIPLAHGHGRTVYRARIVGLERDAAYQACRLLKKAKHPCMELKLSNATQEVAERTEPRAR
jgi:D-alanyl-D-alanine carboxypeptidase